MLNWSSLSILRAEARRITVRFKPALTVERSCLRDVGSGEETVEQEKKRVLHQSFFSLKDINDKMNTCIYCQLKIKV